MTLLGLCNLSKFTSVLKSTSRREICWESDTGHMGKCLWGVCNGGHSCYSATQARCSSPWLGVLKEHFWGGQTRLSSWLFSLLRCNMSLILSKHLYGVTPFLGIPVPGLVGTSEVEEGSGYGWEIPDKATVEVNEVYKSLHISSVL